MGSGSDSISATIGKLQSAIEDLAEQTEGKKEVVPFLTTVCGAFSVESLDGLLEELNTDWYNDEWISALDDKNKSEDVDGIRLRVAVGFLSMLKKALLRSCTLSTDVDKMGRSDFAVLERWWGSLYHTDHKLAPSKSDSKDDDNDGDNDGNPSE